MILNRVNLLITMMLILMIAAGAVVNAAEATLPSPEEVQRHWASTEKFKNPSIQHWREVPGLGTGVWWKWGGINSVSRWIVPGSRTRN